MTKRNPLVRDPRDYPYRIVRPHVPLWRRIVNRIVRWWLALIRKDTKAFYRPGMRAPLGYAFNRRGDLIKLSREYERETGVPYRG